LVWTEARRRGHSLVDVIRWMSAQSAAIVGLRGKGQIRPGNDADLVIFAPDEHWVVDPAALQHRHSVSPYADRCLTGSIIATYLQGRLVDFAGAPEGTLLTPQ